MINPHTPPIYIYIYIFIFIYIVFFLNNLIVERDEI